MHARRLVASDAKTITRRLFMVSAGQLASRSEAGKRSLASEVGMSSRSIVPPGQDPFAWCSGDFVPGLEFGPD